MVKEITTTEQLVKLNEENSNKLLIIDFHAEWCHPCQTMGVILDTLAEERDDFILVKVDVDEADELVNEHKVKNIPTLLFMKGNLILEKTVGSLSRGKIEELINNNLDK